MWKTIDLKLDFFSSKQTSFITYKRMEGNNALNEGKRRIFIEIRSFFDVYAKAAQL